VLHLTKTCKALRIASEDFHHYAKFMGNHTICRQTNSH